MSIKMKVSREYQLFAKPVGARCNLGCRYCYYLEKASLFPEGDGIRMSDDILERYIIQHIRAFPGKVVNFSWHGGEPTLLGVDYFRKVVALQRKHRPSNRRISNGMQTNGTLLDDEWCRFLASEGFSVGISLDGPRDLHDGCRVTRSGMPTFEKAMRGYELLMRHGVAHDILCVVHAGNASHALEVYRFFKNIGARYMGFLPMVAPMAEQRRGCGCHTVPAEVFGEFLCTIFDEWIRHDMGRVRVQMFEEAANTAFGKEQALCVFRKTCGDIPVIEHNGDIFSCDHFVTPEYCLGNIRDAPLVNFLESSKQKRFGRAKWETLPDYCRSCEVLDMCHGGCPKDRIIKTPDGEPGLNYLCPGYHRFFTHCRPFVNQLAALWHERNAGYAGGPKTGRNDPCPCGSGRKYKKCCLGR